MNIKSFNYPRLIFACVVLFIIGETLYERLIQNSFPIFWLDEPLELFVALHTPFSKIFWTALKEIIASMPLFYIEYWLYLQTLNIALPLNELMANLEFYLRLPLIFYSVVTIASAYVMSLRLSRSYIFAGLITLTLFTVNYVSSHLGSEVRFHSAGFAHSALAWGCLALFLTCEKNSNRARYFLLSAWIVTGILAGFSHIYSTYSLFLQIFVVILASLNWVPGLSLSKIKTPAKILSIIFVFLCAAGAGLFFLLSASKPYSRYDAIENMAALQLGLKLLNSYVFLPNIWVWLGLFGLLGFFSFRRETLWKNRFKISFLFLLGLEQFALILLLAWKYLKWNWGPEQWMPRYVVAGFIPFIFFMSYLARDVIPPKWEHKSAIPLALILLFLFFRYPALNDPYWGTDHKEHHGNERWLKLRKDILAVNGYGKVDYVLGIQPTLKPHQQYDFFERSVDISWQLYSGGPLSITTLDKATPFGGRTPLPCEIRDRLPEAIIEAQEYAVDFCEKDQVFLKMVK